MKHMPFSGIVVFGAGGHAKVVADILMRSGRKIFAFIGRKGERGKIFGVSILEEGIPAAEKLLARKDMDYFVAVGDNRIRRKITEKIQKLMKKKPVNAIHPDAVISRHAVIGSGNFINCGVKINAGARIGSHTIINTSATVDHDDVLGDYVQLGPGVHLAGWVSVGRGACVWTGAVVIPKVKVGAEAVVGAGAVVIRDVPSRVTVLGVPARAVK